MRRNARVNSDILITNTTTTSPGGDILTNITTTSTNIEDKNYNFLYEKIDTGSSAFVHDVSNTEYGLKVSKIYNGTPYYENRGAGQSPLACRINNYKLTSNNALKIFNGQKLCGTKNTLANCVGWAHGRVYEIWNRAIEQGYLVPNEDSNDKDHPYKTKDGKLIEGEIKWPWAGSQPYVPASDAVTFYDYWPKSYPGGSISQDPVPGAIMCGGLNGKNGHPGHVAVVEAVYNYGKPDEYVVISESGCTGNGSAYIAHTGIVVRKSSTGIGGTPYCQGNGQYFRGFLISPACQLVGKTENTITINMTEPTEEQKAAYEALTQNLDGSHILRELSKGESVIIEWFGSSLQNEEKRVNLLGGTGKIISVDHTKMFPYAVSITGDNKISAYYRREDIRPIEDKDE